ncbi:DUF4856 domain-containing protein [Niastella populi]|uniref:DUF4856 domain-containing protein n=1 Tax=Niastella populi TaxID=550983 RepID=A0A1V9FZG0_9BACT|nr:DUF4856 domain-containing protein [Niastella populi]OQP63658.1 hypothetical protein A4R26_16950 [Niastella populi]
MKKRTLTLTVIVCSVFVSACDKDDDIAPYDVPGSYNFSNAEFAEATASINMWQGFQFYLGRSASRQLSQDTVNYLWNNTNNGFTNEFITNLPNTAVQLNASGFKLSTNTADPAVIKAMADSMVVVSQFYNTAGAEGKPGKQGSRLFNFAGFEYNQGVAKGMMGALALSKVNAHLDAAVNADNNTVMPGKGTAMEHEWDLAFGYVGIPANYDTTKSYAGTDPERPLAIGGYFAERGKYIKAGGIIFEAFRKGRAAIAAKDYKVRDAASATIKEYLEKTLAAACYYYVTSPQAKTDKVAQLHELSEGCGFIVALKHRASTSKLSASNYQTLVGILGLNQNLYALINDASFTKLKQVQQILTTTYGQLQP